MSFSLFDGAAQWSGVGVTGGGPPPPPPPQPETVWFEDAAPAGAQWASRGFNPWTWMANTPAPFSGTSALYAPDFNQTHEYYFNHAWQPLAFATGESFFIYVNIDPANPPAEIILSFCADNWEHRAYWGENRLSYAVDGSPAQYRVGPLPAAGNWVRLEVPAAAIGIEGQPVVGLSITLSNGRATFDRAGKLGP
jgi:hypothetical protein